MSWFSLLQLFLKVVFAILSKIEKDNLMSAGEARILTKQMEDLNERVGKAIDARQRVADDADAGGLRDDDGYKRPE